jgi:hypothetical protein
MLISCGSDEQTDSPIPFATFSPIVINTSLPSYNALQVDNNFVILQNEGVRGIIVYRENSTTFRAFERICSLQPDSPCSNLDVTALFMRDPCCESMFNFKGEPTGGGLAWRPLLQYQIQVSGTTLTITDNVINY